MSVHDQLLHALNEPVFELAADGRVTFASPALAAWTGRPVDAASPYKFRDALDSREGNRFEQAFKRVLSAKTLATTVALRWVLADGGDAVPVEIKLAGIGGEGGKIVRVAGWLRDTTVETAAEAAANVQSAHLLDLVDNMTDACVVEDAAGNITTLNRAFCELFQIRAAPQSLVGTPCDELFESAAKVVTQRSGPLYVALGARDEAILAESAAEDAEAFEFATAQHDIAQKSFAATHDEAVSGRIHIFRAVPRHAAGANELAAGNTADTAHRARLDETLVEQVAGHLSQTLQSVNRSLDHAAQLEWPEHVTAELTRAKQSADSAFRTIAHLIDQSHLGSAAITVVSGEFSLRETLAELIESLVSLTEPERVALNVRVEQDVPNTLTGDRALLMRVLRQLVEHVLSQLAPADETKEAGGHTSIELSIQPEYSADKLIHLSFTVQLRQDAAALAGRAVHATGALTHLSMARQGAHALAMAADGKPGGAIETRKNKDGFAHHFTAPFPFFAPPLARPRPKFVTLTGANVLIVSADVDERKHLADLVHSWRMQPREADNAAMALYLLNRIADEGEAIPLVITSNALPLQDGFLLALRIKFHPRLRDTIVMMIARDGKQGDAIHCRENGISAYLRHPMRPDQLQDAIMAVMGAEQDAEATQTLITRHSLREAKAGTVLLVDPDREQTRQAAAILRKHDLRVVVAELAEEALAALLQDVFDVIILDVATPGFDSIASGPALLRAQLTGARKVAIIAALHDFERVNGSDYQGVITKPYEKDALLEKVSSAMSANTLGTVTDSRL
jgi:DNA-binding response OmpR family regulator/PAS domain-containing protein